MKSLTFALSLLTLSIIGFGLLLPRMGGSRFIELDREVLEVEALASAVEQMQSQLRMTIPDGGQDKHLAAIKRGFPGVDGVQVKLRQAGADLSKLSCDETLAFYLSGRLEKILAADSSCAFYGFDEERLADWDMDGFPEYLSEDNEVFYFRDSKPTVYSHSLRTWVKPK